MQHVSSVLGTHKRRRRIMSDFFLDCACRRCSDATECGTFVSGVTCEACEAGVMLPADPLDVLSEWACSDCDFVLPSDVVEHKVDSIEEELSAISARGSLRKLEEFIECYSGRVLHRNHYLILLARRNFLLVARRREVNRLAERGGGSSGGLSQDDARYIFNWASMYKSEF